MGHLVIGDRAVDRGRLDPAQADLRARLQGDRPRKAPAVAVEHRQGPQIGRVQPHVPDQDVADRVQIGAAVMVDHALGPAGGARGVVERDRLPFIGRKQRREVRIALVQERLVGGLAEPLARLLTAAMEQVVDDVDHLGPGLAQRQRLLDHAGKLGVGQQQLGLAVVEDVGDAVGLEPDVQGVQHRARHRHAIGRLEGCGDVGRHHRDRIARPHAAPGQRRCKFSAARPKRGIGPGLGAVDPGDPLREHVGRALQKAERRERRIVGRVPLQVLLVRAAWGVLGESHGPASAQTVLCSGTGRGGRAASLAPGAAPASPLAATSGDAVLSASACSLFEAVRMLKGAPCVCRRTGGKWRFLLPA